jgi:hypothetical protein
MATEWKREAVWSESDTRRRRRHSIVWTAFFTIAIGALVAANHACYELVFLSKERLVRAEYVPVVIARECASDSDCVLMPSIVTCCGECEPAPPFAAAPRSELAQLRAWCEPPERECDPPLCSPVPDGCDARAECRAGECKAVANDRCSEP